MYNHSFNNIFQQTSILDYRMIKEVLIMKKRLTEQQEFEIMKIILDKFLWLGMGIMAYGVYRMITTSLITEGLPFLIMGIVILVAFLVLIIREYEIIR